MPYNKYENLFKTNSILINVAEATGDWRPSASTPEIYERIQGIVIDTRYLLMNYDGNHDRDKEMLSSEIEKVKTFKV